MSLRKSFFVLIAIVIGVVALDQVTKLAARQFLVVGEPVPVVPNLFDFVLVYNEGAAFGMFQGATAYFVIIAAVVTIAVVLYIVMNPRHTILETVSLSLVVAGALGNLFDRLFADGQVTDFIATAFIDFPVFNVADISVTCGCVLFIASMFVSARFDKENTEEDSVHER